MTIMNGNGNTVHDRSPCGRHHRSSATHPWADERGTPERPHL